MTNYSQIKGIIFDLDGTLVESNLDFQRIREELGCPLDTDLLYFVDNLACPNEQSNANRIIIEHEQQDALDCKPIAGAPALLALLNKMQLPHALVTRNSHHATQAKLKKNNINMATVLTREDYPAKPAPDALLAIAAQWKTEPHEIIYVGDYLYDIMAANNAGMIACLINHGRPASYQSQAQLVIEHLGELVAYLDKNDSKKAYI